MSQVFIEITGEPIFERKGTGQGGREYHIRKQRAWMHKPGQPYPDQVQIQLDRDQVPYAPGEYDLAPTSYGVDKYGAISIRPVLSPRQKTLTGVAKSA